jgi:hypothetical protein
VTRTTAAICAAIAALGLAACGGDDDDEAAAPTAADTAMLAADGPLDQESWDEYLAVRDEARAVNDEAVTTFRRCRDLLGTDVPETEVEECLGASVADVVDEGEQVLALLDGFEDEVGGACAGARTNLHGTVKLYVSSVNAIGLDLERSSLPTDNDVDSAVRTLGAARAAQTVFEEECMPA